MDYFNAKEYLYIDIANHFGHDKISWKDRIQWTKTNEHRLESLIKDADSVPLYAKAVHTLRQTQAGNPVGHPMSLDATASGLQIMAALIGCHVTASRVNLIDTNKREDVYEEMSQQMNSIHKTSTNRKEIKPAIMTHFYGSKATPQRIFGTDTPELGAFYSTLATAMPGAQELMKDLQWLQDNGKSEFSWTMPDGHVVVCKAYIADDKVFRVPALNDASFTYRHYVNEPDPHNKSIPANVVHSVDGYIVREMIRRCHRSGVQLGTIHDSFWAHPSDMDLVRYYYKEILAEIAESNLMQDIARELSGDPTLGFKKHSTTLGALIRKSNYALS